MTRGRKRSGTLTKTRDGRWQARITLPDGSRKRLPAFPAGTSKAKAEEALRAYVERAESVIVERPAVYAEDASAMGRWFAA